MPGRLFYVFTGLHSLLIGLFPFYIPVYLYTIGLTLSQICLFIAATGIGYCLALFLWDRVCRRVSFRFLIIWSFVSEYLLLSMFFFDKGLLFVLCAGLVNGIFNCNFWTIQRLLFARSTSSENSGKNFGNFQIFVLVILKAGILLGGFMLEKGGFMLIYLFSGGLILCSPAVFSTRLLARETSTAMTSATPISLSAMVHFTDHLRSRSVFIIDGVFLYLESYFWVISLFFLVRENFLRLGLLVIVLAVLFGLLFWLIKNSIDRLSGQKMYMAAVVLYGFSWALRGVLGEQHSPVTMLWLLTLITMCTSIFRLSFNKRFFDNARLTNDYQYIFTKSSLSQFCLALFFLVLAAYLRASAMSGGVLRPESVVDRLSGIYYLAAAASLIYLLYRTGDARRLH